MQNFMKRRHPNNCQDGAAGHKISVKRGRQNTNRIQVNFVSKDVKSALFLSKLVIRHNVVCTAVVDVGCITCRINQQSSDLKYKDVWPRERRSGV